MATNVESASAAADIKGQGHVTSSPDSISSPANHSEIEFTDELDMGQALNFTLTAD